MHAVEVIEVGDALGVVLPKEVLSRLRVEKGDSLFLTDSADGVRLTSQDPAFETQMKEARAVMRKRRIVLRELAK